MFFYYVIVLDGKIDQISRVNKYLLYGFGKEWISWIMAYSTQGHISYILEASSKRPMREKRKEVENEVKLCWTDWMGWYSFFCAFKILMIKGIIYF